jgi:prepilin-type N-terminal cleavage/methylation domain-containing protein
VSRSGFTLLEVVVVLVLIGLTTAIVAPSLLPPDRGRSVTLQGVIALMQAAALRRGETLVLEVSAEGEWTAFGTAVPDEVVATGRLDGDPPPGRIELRVAPLGSCGWDVEPEPSTWVPPLDPLTCTLSVP